MPAKLITAERMRQIEAAAGCGLSDAEVATVVGIRPEALERPRVRRVIDTARARTTQQVAAALIRKALAGNIPAAMFYLKAKAGWRDTDAALEREAAERLRRVPRVLILDEGAFDPPAVAAVAGA